MFIYIMIRSLIPPSRVRVRDERRDVRVPSRAILGANHAGGRSRRGISVWLGHERSPRYVSLPLEPRLPLLEPLAEFLGRGARNQAMA
jgi:hypothetical protein